MVNQCFLFGVWEFPGGTCAQWFSGSASALAVAIALGGYFWSERRFRKQELISDQEHLAGVSLLLRALLDEAQANQDMFLNAKRSFVLGEREYAISANLSGVMYGVFPLLDKAQARFLISCKCHMLAKEIDGIAMRINLHNVAIKDYATSRRITSDIIQELISEEIDFMKPPNGDARITKLRNKLEYCEEDFTNLSDTSNQLLSKVIKACVEFNKLCGRNGFSDHDFTVSVEDARKMLQDPPRSGEDS